MNRERGPERERARPRDHDRERERSRSRRVCFQLARRPDFVPTIDSASQWMDTSKLSVANSADGGEERRGQQEAGDANPCKWLSLIAYFLAIASKYQDRKPHDFTFSHQNKVTKQTS
jgi:hypothetical protein